MARRAVLAPVLAALLALPVPVIAGEGDGAKPKPPATPGGSSFSRHPKTKREALRILGNVLVSVNFDETPLRDVVGHLGVLTGVNVIVAPALLKDADPDLLRVTLRLKKVSARQVLEMTAESLGLGIGFQSGVLTVTTAKEARGKPVLRLYVLSDITMPIRDFPGPDMMLHPAGAERTPVEESETKPAFSDADDILRILKETVGTGTWEDDGVSASVMKEWLVVRQYEEVHEQIARVLALLRSAR